MANDTKRSADELDTGRNNVHAPGSELQRSSSCVYGMKMEGFHMGDFKEDILDSLEARDWKDPPLLWN